MQEGEVLIESCTPCKNPLQVGGRSQKQMNIVGRKVSHKKFGPGEIASLEKNGDITISFDKDDEKPTRRFQFPQPFVDGKYLTTDDAELAAAIEKLIETGDISPIMADSLQKAEARPEPEFEDAQEPIAPEEPEPEQKAAKAEAHPKAAPEAKPKAKPAPAAEHKDAAAPEPNAEAEAAPEAKTESKAPAKTPVKALDAKAPAKDTPEAKAEAPAKAASKPKADPKAPAKAAPKAASEAKTEAKAASKAPSKSSAEGKPATKAPAKTASKSAGAKAKPAPEAASEAEGEDTPKKTTKSDYRPPERVDGVPHTFFVFQTKTFQQGAKGGYIWAPYSLTDGTTQTCWDILEYVMPGDIIIHGEDAKIKAISQVESRCYEAPRPPEFDSKPRFSETGRKIDCAYVLAGTKVPTKTFLEDIKRLAAPRKYSPFNSNGTGNTGYLYDLDPVLAQIFIRGLANANPQLIKIEFIKEFLSLKLESEDASK